jgi:FkbM family methyltransferase
LLERSFRLSAGDEGKFSRAMFAQIRPGEVVWDVGANHGHYTSRFADAVGDSGTIVAFEPAEATFESLMKRSAGRGNVHCENAALGDFDGQADFFVSTGTGSEYDIGHLAMVKGQGRVKTVSQVRVLKGDTYCAREPQLAPHRIKIDVEGYEYEVLLGLSETLKSSRLLSVFIEVHFTFLRDRGLGDAPAKMVALLRAHAFRPRWAGPCHLVASRSGPR